MPEPLKLLTRAGLPRQAGRKGDAHAARSNLIRAIKGMHFWESQRPLILLRGTKDVCTPRRAPTCSKTTEWL
eukprot:1921418-Amphidinium_carterae.2